MIRCACFLILFLPAVCALSQRLSFSGKVTDGSGSPLADVSVHILNTTLGANTDANGNFIIPSIPGGSYVVEISAVGYATLQKGVVVASSRDIPIAFQLGESSTQLNDVIVTAEKTEENLQAIPSSVTSLSARQIQDYRIWNSKDITAIVPNLYAANPGDGRNVTSIRGITSTSYDPAVATYIDGVNQFGLDTYIAQLFDVERVEVLRGPQGTLYGRNAMGGVINIITKQPTNQTEGFAEANLGNFGQQRYVAAVRTPLIKNKLFLGVSAVFDHNNGFYTNTHDSTKFDRRHSFTGNYYLKFIASTKLNFTFNLKHNQNRNMGAFPLAYEADALAHPFNVDQDAVTQMIDNIFNTSLSVGYNGDHFNFTSQSAYQSNYRYYKDPIDGDFSPLDGITIKNNYGKSYNDVKVLTQEFKFASAVASSSVFKWAAGTYLFYQNSPVKQAIHYGLDAKLLGVPDSSFATISTSKGINSGFAFFGQGALAVSSKLDITAGMRYDFQHSKLNIMGEYQKDGQAPIVTRSDTSSSASFNAISPKCNLAYKLSETSMIYATYARGFRTGGLSQLSSDPTQPPLYPYKPEYSNNFEAGSKNMFFANRLRANVAVFYINVTNAQVPRLILPDAVTLTSNVGQLTSTGAELELSTALAKGLQLDLNGGVNNARYKKFKLSPTDSIPPQSGKKQVFTSPVTAMIALQYSFAFVKAKQLRIVIRGESMYLGKKYFNYGEAPLTQNGYDLINFRAGVAAKSFEVMFWGRNLSNRTYIDYAYDFGAVHFGNPRNYGLTIRKNF